MVGAANGTITPAGGGVFSWTVTGAGDGIKLQGEFNATSTAGVARGTWTQRTQSLPNVVRIVGTFTGSLDADDGDGSEHWSWGGSATFGPRPYDQPGASGEFPLAGGTVTYVMTFTADGPGRFGGCSAQGSATKQLNDQDFYGSWLVTTFAEDGLSPPYDYTGDINPLTTEAGHMAVTLHGCPDPDDNGSTRLIDIMPVLSAGTSEGPAMSPDGLTYAGTYAVDSNLPVVWNWDFHGETE